MAWIAHSKTSNVIEKLNDVGIPAVRALDGMELLNLPALLGCTVASDPEGGLVKGMPYRLGDEPFSVSRMAPNLGEHTTEVLRDVLHLDEAEMNRLESLGVTRATPSM